MSLDKTLLDKMSLDKLVFRQNVVRQNVISVVLDKTSLDKTSLDETSLDETTLDERTWSPFSIQRPSKLYPHWDFWDANMYTIWQPWPRDRRPVLKTKLPPKFIQTCISGQSLFFKPVNPAKVYFPNQ
jgi:hypothetical protein